MFQLTNLDCLVEYINKSMTIQIEAKYIDGRCQIAVTSGNKVITGKIKRIVLCDYADSKQAVIKLPRTFKNFVVKANIEREVVKSAYTLCSVQ